MGDYSQKNAYRLGSLLVSDKKVNPGLFCVNVWKDMVAVLAVLAVVVVVGVNLNR